MSLSRQAAGAKSPNSLFRAVTRKTRSAADWYRRTMAGRRSLSQARAGLLPLELSGLGCRATQGLSQNGDGLSVSLPVSTVDITCLLFCRGSLAEAARNGTTPGAAAREQRHKAKTAHRRPLCMFARVQQLRHWWVCPSTDEKELVLRVGRWIFQTIAGLLN